MEKLIRNSWILQAYFTENYYPKEIVQLIIALQLQLHQPDCNQHHNFFSFHNEIYFHTATKKANIEIAKSLLVYPDNKHSDWKLNCLEWQSDLRKIYGNKIIVLVDVYDDMRYYTCEKRQTFPVELCMLSDISFSQYQYSIFTIGFLKKYLDKNLLIGYTIILSKCENELLYPVSMHFPTFHVHM